MSVGVVSGIAHPQYGGPSSVLGLHVRALARHVDVAPFFVCPPGGEQLLRNQFPHARLFPLAFPRSWYVGKGLAPELRQAASSLGLIHSHMLWDQPVLASWQAAKSAGIPHIITPHGSLMTSWRAKSLKKDLYRVLLLNRILRDCAAIHALTHEEETACREFGITTPIYVIPNALDDAIFDQSPSSADALRRWPELQHSRVLLYLGRLWSGKGLDILPRAWAATCRAGVGRDWTLVIAGPDYRGFKDRLMQEVVALTGASQIKIIDEVSGAEKWSLLNLASAVVLPSYSEAFSMVLLEACAARRPSLYSRQCSFPELADAGGGWLVDANLDSLTDGLRSLVERSDEDLRLAGENAWSFARGKYTASKVGQQLFDMYQNIVAGRNSWGT